jgi:hypothetical protein
MAARSVRLLIVAALAAAATVGCTVGQKKSAVLGAARDEGRRRELFEATLRALDEKPEYVDEFFALALEHPRTVDRFVENNAAHLHEPPLAAMTAEALVRYPAGLREVQVQTLDAARDKVAARRAIAQSIADRPKEAAAAITESSDAVDRSTRALVDAVLLARPEVRGGFLAAMRARKTSVARILTAEPDLALDLGRAFLGVTAKESGIADELRRLLGRDDGAKRDERRQRDDPPRQGRRPSR